MGPSFGELLRHHRGAAGLTQEALAERAGIGVRTIQDLERGDHQTPQAETAHRLATALGLAGPQRAAFLASAQPDRRTLSATPARFGRGPRSPLPTPLTTLVGRDEEVAAVVRLLQAPTVRLVTLTGPGGVGKTRLALAAAAAGRDRFPDGTTCVSLAPIRDPVLVLPTIAQGLRVRTRRGPPLVESLATALRDRRLLLVLDNFEHLLAAGPPLVDLLTLCADLKVLVTSRAPLRVRGEREIRIQPLALPAPTMRPTPETLMTCPAVRLLAERAHDVRPDFVLTAANAAAVAEICRRLDGLPLAIELAAARLRVLSPQALLPRLRLRRRLDELAPGPADLPAHQQTLRDTIRWSYDLLEPAEQTLFRRLSVSAGECTLGTVEAICAADRQGDALDALDLLAALVSKSLVRQQEAPDGELRFWMLETIREFAHDQLVASGEAPAIESRHAGHYLTLAAEHDLVHGLRPPRWLDAVEQDVANFRAALQWLEAHGRHGDALRLAARLAPMWSNRGYVEEGFATLRRLLDRPENAAPTVVRAFCLWYAGLFARYGGDLGAARLLDEESLAVATAVDDQVGVAYATLDLGWIAREAGEFVGARPCHENALSRFRALGHEVGIALALDQLARTNHALGEAATARSLQEESLAIRRRLGHPWGIGSSLVHLGDLAVDREDWRAAATYYRECLGAVRAMGTRVHLSAAIEGLAMVAVSTGQPKRGLRLLAAAGSLREASGAGSDRVARDRHLVVRRRAASRLSPEAAAQVETAGRALTLDEALSDALATPATARRRAARRTRAAQARRRLSLKVE